jgi:hypothetical protein
MCGKPGRFSILISGSLSPFRRRCRRLKRSMEPREVTPIHRFSSRLRLSRHKTRYGSQRANPCLGIRTRGIARDEEHHGQCGHCGLDRRLRPAPRVLLLARSSGGGTSRVRLRSETIRIPQFELVVPWSSVLSAQPSSGKKPHKETGFLLWDAYHV